MTTTPWTLGSPGLWGFGNLTGYTVPDPGAFGGLPYTGGNSLPDFRSQAPGSPFRPGELDALIPGTIDKTRQALGNDGASLTQIGKYLGDAWDYVNNPLPKNFHTDASDFLGFTGQNSALDRLNGVISEIYNKTIGYADRLGIFVIGAIVILAALFMFSRNATVIKLSKGLK